MVWPWLMPEKETATTNVSEMAVEFWPICEVFRDFSRKLRESTQCDISNISTLQFEMLVFISVVCDGPGGDDKFIESVLLTIVIHNLIVCKETIPAKPREIFASSSLFSYLVFSTGDRD